MARDLTVPVRQFTVTALAEPGAVADIVGARVYGTAVPAPPLWPFVRMDLPVATPDTDGCGGQASSYALRVHAFAKGDDERAVGQLAAAIASVLDERTGIAVVEPEAFVRDTVWTGTEIFRDTAEVNGWHGVVSMTAFVSG